MKKYIKKRKGEVATFTMLFATLFLIFLLVYGVQVRQFRALKTSTEDALAASNLASAVIDVEEYGRTHNLLVENPDHAYQLYRKALQTNMGLTDSWESPSGAIAGPVVVKSYILYNVRETDVDIYAYGEDAYFTTIPGGLGSVKSPNGKIIESTSVYSCVTFPVDGFFGVRVQAVQDKLVDIVESN